MLSTKKGAPQTRGKKYEIEKAKDHGAKRIGGPNNPDAIIKGGGKMEMKDWQNPVSKPIVVDAKRKGVTKFVAKNGFTKPAIDYAKKTGGIKLYKGKKKII